MKWWEFQDDCGDGTYRMLRFRTKEEAEQAREKAENCPYFQCDGDGSPVMEVDTESKYFFDSVNEVFE